MKTLIFILILLGVKVQADVSFDSVPSWVRSVEIPRLGEPLEGMSGSPCYLLYETQIYEDTQEMYRRLALRLTNQKNIHEESQIEISFNPLYEELKLHELSVCRGGEKIDKRDSSKIAVLQRELGLEAHIIDGYKSAVILIDDVRVGDVIIYSFSIKGRHPAYRGHFFLNHSFDYDVPVERNYLRVLVPQNKAVSYKSYGDCDIPFKITPLCNDKEWIFDIPGGSLENSSIELSEFNNWGEVASLFTPHYTISLPNDDGQSLYDTAMEVTAGAFSKAEKAVKLLRFVQEEVRYFGTELGLNAFHPALPQQTLQKRYGDCKDKVLLLRALLSLVGIQSTPILVRTYDDTDLLFRIPNPSIFNHVILRIEINGEEYFVDPTLTSQGGALTSLVPLHYKNGLALHEKSSKIVSLPSEDPAAPRIDIETIYTPDLEGNLEVNKSYKFQGSEANFFRHVIDNQQVGSDFRSMQSYLSMQFGEVIDSKYHYHDDLDQNVIVLEESYSIQLPNSKENLLITPHHLHDYIMQKVDLSAKSPIWQEYPKNIHETIRFHTPFSKHTKANTYSHPWGKFAYSLECNKEGMVLECDYQARSSEVHPHEFIEFRSYLNALAAEIPREITLPDKKAVQEDLHKESGYTILAIGLAVIIYAISQYFTKHKPNKDQWFKRLSLLKKQ